MDVVVLDFRVPAGGLRLRDRDAEDPVHDLEHAAEHALHFKVGAQLLGVEVVALLAQLLGPVRHVPGRQFGRVRPRLFAVVSDQLAVFLLKGGAGPGFEVALEGHGALTAGGHPVSRGQIGEGGKAQQRGPLAPQPQNARQQQPVVAALPDADQVVSAGQFLAQAAVVGVGQQRMKDRGVQGQAVQTGPVVRLGVTGRRLDQAQGHT